MTSTSVNPWCLQAEASWKPRLDRRLSASGDILEVAAPRSNAGPRDGTANRVLEDELRTDGHSTAGGIEKKRARHRPGRLMMCAAWMCVNFRGPGPAQLQTSLPGIEVDARTSRCRKTSPDPPAGRCRWTLAFAPDQRRRRARIQLGRDDQRSRTGHSGAGSVAGAGRLSVMLLPSSSRRFP